MSSSKIPLTSSDVDLDIESIEDWSNGLLEINNSQQIIRSLNSTARSPIANWTSETPVLIQGISTPLGRYAASQMKAHRTRVVAGVSVGQGGRVFEEIPICNLVEEAIAQVGSIEISLIFVEPYAVLDAALEAIAAGIRQLILCTQNVPPLDAIRLSQRAKETNTLILGSGSAGAIVPEKLLLGTCEPQFFTPGSVGLIGRSEILTSEVALELSQAQIGQSIAVNLGTDDILGSTFQQWLRLLESDADTEAILLIEHSLSGTQSAAAEYIAAEIEKPIVAYIAGLKIPVLETPIYPASAIASYCTQPIPHTDTAEQKVKAFKKAKIPVAKHLSQIPNLVKKALKKSGKG
ncbi:CoA-binding protein [Lusitaniella coriacea LEGE 07157]|uniref:CoA-binding protein n=1 Tax=Lusitaniella coriacea LEGE 07157 TaxID=945747 RepID=A0A8J7DVE6_9CYAN|nr:CoA-binding protein [Lusitaniella coriacea]MBE9115718.1 CoA-binding protein [Lusitaniella coriacea LEGE 07157]